ncbi:MAG: acyl-CoA reductase [Bacteroidales bacterium]
MPLNAFIQLGNLLQGDFARLGLTQGIKNHITSSIQQSQENNAWFTKHNIYYALHNIVDEMLNENALKKWLLKYPTPTNQHPLDVGLIMAGNIPLVGFHDFLCTLLAGHRAVIKCSKKDAFLLPMLAKFLCQIDYKLHERIVFVDELPKVHAIIATGSNNTIRYLEHEYPQTPHIFRHNRTSVAVLDGTESAEDLTAMTHDVLDYFGLGCRNVSKIFVPQKYDVLQLKEAFLAHTHVTQHPFYADCYRYAKALHITKNTNPLFDFENCILSYQTPIQSPIAQVFVEEYRDENQIQKTLLTHRHALQCVASKIPVNSLKEYCVPFGKTQKPKLTDYADGVDTLKFLLALSQRKT